eukprot:2991192-Pyramimonas_sp.AAC.1
MDEECDQQIQALLRPQGQGLGEDSLGKLRNICLASSVRKGAQMPRIKKEVCSRKGASAAAAVTAASGAAASGAAAAAAPTTAPAPEAGQGSSH